MKRQPNPVVSIIRPKPSPFKERLRKLRVGQHGVARHLGRSLTYVNKRLLGYKRFTEAEEVEIESLLRYAERESAATENTAEHTENNQ